MDNYSYNRIIIVGNGYDRALNLPTSYNDFLLDYLKSAVFTAFEKDYNEDPLFKIPHVRYAKPDNLKAVLESINDIPLFLNQAKLNYEFQYTTDFFDLLIDHVLDKNWVDIENLYFNLLIRKISSIQKSDPLNRKYDSIEELNQQMNFLKKKLEEYLIKVQLNHRISPLDSPMQSIHSEFNEKLLGIPAFKLHGKHDSEIENPSKVVFLNFNFTNFLSQVAFSRWQGNFIINIHGELNNSRNPIIFGYGDDSHPIYESLENEQSDEPLKQIKSFYYPKTDNYHQVLGVMSEKPYEVFIVGHSCGLSDRTLLKTIFEDDNCLGIKIYHRGNEHDHFLKNIAISRHFQNKVKLRDKILPYDEHAIIPQAK